jgi:hypothetical protein
VQSIGLIYPISFQLKSIQKENPNASEMENASAALARMAEAEQNPLEGDTGKR